MPRRNRVDPFGDLYAVAARGLFTGNRGCLVNSEEKIIRHNGSVSWIVCDLEFRGWRWPLARPKRWTPIFFLDDAVALAAGHRPCSLCRREDYRSYRDAISQAISRRLLAKEINARLGEERLGRGRGLARAADRLLWKAPFSELPDGSVILNENGSTQLIFCGVLFDFNFRGWHPAADKPNQGMATILTPPTSVTALQHGYIPTLHPSTTN
ncbi:MAG: hypothetical protein VX986_01510 [Pseudomonadota bacterium]|nr:hypothetical protein [Pseudomonadota bacterium]